MPSFRSLLPVIALAVSLSPRLVLAATDDSDVILQVLGTEVDRAAHQLKDAPDAPLYYVAARVHDGTAFHLQASYGALTTLDDEDSLAGRMRLLDVTARVGTRDLDSTHKLRGEPPSWDFSDYDPSLKMLPIENDAGALRLSIWRAMDHAYRGAVKSYFKVRANKLVKVAEEDSAADFDEEPPHVYIGPRSDVTLDKKLWDERLKEVSARFKSFPHVLQSDVSLEGWSWTTYFVASDGSRIREPQSFARIIITGHTKADDGMELELYRDFEAVTPDQLPSEEKLAAAVDELGARLEALRQAPVIEPFSGPAIVMNQAAGVMFHEILGHRIEGGRQKDADEGHTFTHKVGQQIVPAFISVVDDPTRAAFDTLPLNGHYLYDDEGVPARPVTVIQNGVLKSFLLGRSPLKDFAQSNGHGRAQAGLQPEARQGNLIVSASQSVPFATLRQQLIAEVKRQGKPYGLMFEDISGGFTQTRAAMLPQAFKVLPLIVKRVYPDGRPDELVRGVDMVGTPIQTFEQIMAAADDPKVFNGFCGAESGWVPVSAVAPSILVRQIEVERKSPSHDRMPLLPPPLHPDAPWPAPPSDQPGAGKGEGR